MSVCDKFQLPSMSRSGWEVRLVRVARLVRLAWLVRLARLVRLVSLG